MKNFESFVNSDMVSLLEKGKRDGVETVWDRVEAMKAPCGLGSKGLCCRICAMGPCRISPVPGKGSSRGICGATADVIVSRNLARMVAAGTAAHSDHARGIIHLLHQASREGDYTIKNPDKLISLAKEWHIDTEGKDIYEIGHMVAEVALENFGKAFGEMKLPASIPEIRKELWRRENIMPRAIDREVVSIMHSTHIGCMADAEEMLRMALRTSLADGWAGSYMGTAISDILFNVPKATKTESNLAVLEENQVNIILHGHEPSLSEMILLAVSDSQLVTKAKEVGADGINLVGMCCTGNELSMRHGTKNGGNFLQQELAVITGTVEAVIVDVQCILPSLAELTKKYHTDFITTSPTARITGATHIEFNEEHAYESAKKIVLKAIENFPNRNKEDICIPDTKTEFMVGYSVEEIIKHMDKVANENEKGTLMPLVNTIAEKKIRGVAALVGCNNPRIKQDYNHIKIAEKLIENNILVVATGCSATALAKAGLVNIESAKLAGDGLRSVCEGLNIPPVLHMGSCVDISRILQLTGEVAKLLNVDISDLPVVGVAPEWMSEKAVAIGVYVVSTGIDTWLGVLPQITGSEKVVNILVNDIENIVGAKFFVETDPIKTAEQIIERIDMKRQKLGI
ncbi:MAG: anaerobic carbon-monoxide dehydrogenase catalytic subunit [Anaeromicrobium sp.]|jgi:carbon-monoxide dehydrogenase catalytic subunit|uniref:anaerobic carbon-monoxide dehydrogenase catalytic subunit n=1 Tax=Anaeromicrobium sp. TaxID=1929132 RepID=UPI0025F5CA80|nr:anaerobic carbon-monoxide dehydrogenase catalytic subunit [Anaeromicrobium sp.]MCT4595089.1 anaerobic carbon-monoxide dehydrogenase catalytic subunit [Anaeromicrobium sp.]